jgi:hypothetical protein
LEVHHWQLDGRRRRAHQVRRFRRQFRQPTRHFVFWIVALLVFLMVKRVVIASNVCSFVKFPVLLQHFPRRWRPGTITLLLLLPVLLLLLLLSLLFLTLASTVTLTVAVTCTNAVTVFFCCYLFLLLLILSLSLALLLSLLIFTAAVTVPEALAT